jgi:hypothetical protein
MFYAIFQKLQGLETTAFLAACMSFISITGKPRMLRTNYDEQGRAKHENPSEQKLTDKAKCLITFTLGLLSKF